MQTTGNFSMEKFNSEYKYRLIICFYPNQGLTKVIKKIENWNFIFHFSKFVLPVGAR
jgi:hypothetical protein